jgi:hypothetical protein
MYKVGRYSTCIFTVYSPATHRFGRPSVGDAIILVVHIVGVIAISFIQPSVVVACHLIVTQKLQMYEGYDFVNSL